MTSIDDTEEAAVRNAKAPRVSLSDIEDAIAYSHYTTGGHIVTTHHGWVPSEAKSLEVLTICLLVMRNGFTVIGKSAPAHADNYDADLGVKFAYEDAIRQLWPLMGFALRDRLWRDSEDAMQFYKATEETT